jgi:hypothetical protein
MLDLVTALPAQLLDETEFLTEEAGRAFFNLSTLDALAAAQTKG